MPYLRLRALSMIPAIITATGFAAYRGLLNTVTPLKVSLLTNTVNLVLDPLMIFTASMGFRGAAAATAFAEGLGGLIYMRLLLKRRLATWGRIVKPPTWASIWPILQGGASMLARQVALNAGWILAARRAQAMDPTSGIAAAAYGIVMQLYAVGIVVHVAMQGTAAALVSKSKAENGTSYARRVANRMFLWGGLVGLFLGVAQFVLMPWILPLFSTIPSVHEAAKMPAVIASIMNMINGPVFVGEGIMLGLGSYRDLTIVTALSVGSLATLLLKTPLGNNLHGILWCKATFCLIQAIAVVTHFLKFSPLAARKTRLPPFRWRARRGKE
eukprot:CAMPEP_0116824718 /NCGR_PEP_ID=MMETSP0418-20121206/1553_1 /TAXON_ID=1158023 /ORGANISM="Astrosyne radiata, Strain 13vi08-1A" /LENGTH=327 /DNA_ID=CAMNT_0004453121 /DNA_START=1 /DNA_END=984 /DNA_ORIENTATION=+